MAAFSGRKCWCILCAVLIIPLVSFSQRRFYHLPALTDSALHHMPSLSERQALLSAAQARVTDVRHSFLPVTKFGEQVTLGTDNSIAGSYFTLGITPSSSAGVRGGNTSAAATGDLAVLYSEYDLYNFGLNDARLANAKAYVDLQQADVERERYVLSVNVAKTYFNLLSSLYRLNADEQNVERYKRIYNIIQALAFSGIIPGADSSLAMAEWSKARIGYNQSLAKADELKEQLSFFTGISSSQLLIDTSVDKLAP